MACKYIDWTPISFDYKTNKLNMESKLIGSKEGLIFSHNPLLHNVKDIAANENTIALLTNNCSLSSLQASAKPVVSLDNLTRNSLITLDGHYLTNDSNNIVTISTSAENLDNVFQLEFEDQNFVRIIAEDINSKKYLTMSSIGTYAYFGEYSSLIDFRQKFKYNLDQKTGQILLFSDYNNSGIYKVVKYNTNNPTQSLSATSTFTSSAVSCSLFALANLDTSIKTHVLSSSFAVKYETNLDNNDTIYNDLNIGTKIPFSNNYMFTIEPKSTDKTANAVALKNLFTVIINLFN